MGKRGIKGIESGLDIKLASYLLAVPVDRNDREDTGTPSCCRWGLEPWRPSDKETPPRTGPKARPDPRTHRSDQLDTCDTHLQTRIDSTDLGPGLANGSVLHLASRRLPMEVRPCVGL